MSALPNPWLSEFADSTPRSAEAPVTSSPGPNRDVTGEQFDELPEPPPLCLTTPHPQIDRDLEAMVRMLIAKRASRREMRA